MNSGQAQTSALQRQVNKGKDKEHLILLNDEIGPAMPPSSTVIDNVAVHLVNRFRYKTTFQI